MGTIKITSIIGVTLNFKNINFQLKMTDTELIYTPNKIQFNRNVIPE